MRVKTVSTNQHENETNEGEHDAEVAIDLAGFGKFNIKIVLLCGLMYLNTGFSISSVGLVLPSASCDFNLTTVDKGRITAAPMLGMILGSYFWGCLGDIEGRRFALLGALYSHGFFELVSSVIPNYWGYVVLKFLSGVSIHGQTGLLFTYLGEFQSAERREKILCWMEMAWSLGLIALPLVGWAIIPLNIAFVTDTFFFRSWNLFVAVCSLPSIIIATWLLSFPETPKYLAELGDNEKFARALEVVYKENTGKSFNDYMAVVTMNGNESLIRRLKSVQNTDKTCARRVTKTNAIVLVENIFSQTLKLFKPPFLQRTAISCSIMFCLASSYYALMLWFPELFQRFATFESNYPNESTSVCKVSHRTNETVTKCPSDIPTEVYRHTLILGVACVPLSMILPLFVDKLGYKFYLVISTFIAALVTVGLFFVKSSLQNLILSCIFEAFSSVGMSIIFCINVDLFPTNMRVLAAALCGLTGRFGALIGNSLFGYLIDEHCVILITIIAVQLFVCAVLGIFIPIKRKSKKNNDKSTS